MNTATTDINPYFDATAVKRRRHFRFHCLKDATVRVNGHSRIRGRIINASEAGVCVEVAKSQSLQNGAKVTVEWTVLAELYGGSTAERCVIPGTVVRTTNGGFASQTHIIQFNRLVREQLSMHRSRVTKAVTALAAVSLMAAIGLFKINNVVYFWYHPWLEAYSIGAAAFVLSRVVLSLFYKEPADRGYYPTVSIIVAAKNEEAHMAKTIEHCLNSHYPPNLIEIFAVDDGSTDGTWKVLQELQQKYPQLNAIRFEKNRGKRHAMAIGAEKAHGDVLVYVDSDSYIGPDSLYRIVQPFAEKNVGAVSGHVLAAIEHDNFISKMEAVRYFISHRIMKAAESVFGTVTCCPGAFSAYRRTAVVKVVPDWINQKFCGTAATFGDDRSLTNYIMRDFKVIYHAGALCVTYVPRTLRQFFRQQLRWKKSWARETTVASRILYRKHPVAALSYYLGVVLTLVSPLVAIRALLFLPLLAAVSPLPYIFGLFLVSLSLCLVYLYHTQSRYWYYGMLFAVFYLFFFSFQNYYAIATVRRNHWGTR